MKFPYLKIPGIDPRKPWISRPIIPVIISHKDKSIRVNALIDSGADLCFFHYELGKRLGLNIEKGRLEDITGIEGIRTPVWIHNITFQIVGSDHQIFMPVGFTKSPGVFAILGQEGFFDAFRIKFERDHNVVEIVPVKKLSSSS